MFGVNGFLPSHDECTCQGVDPGPNVNVCSFPTILVTTLISYYLVNWRLNLCETDSFLQGYNHCLFKILRVEKQRNLES
jgi:hypothetical protein